MLSLCPQMPCQGYLSQGLVLETEEKRGEERRTGVERSRGGSKDRGIHYREYNGCASKTYTVGEKKCELRENNASVTIVPGHR